MILSIFLLQIGEGWIADNPNAADYRFLFKRNDPTMEDILNLRQTLAKDGSAWIILLLLPTLIFLAVAVRSVAKARRSFKKPGLG